MALTADLQNDTGLLPVDRDAVAEGLIAVLPQPSGGEEIVIELVPGQILDFQALALADAILIKDGDDLRLDFGADGSLLLKDFFPVAEGEAPPTLILRDAIEIPIEAVLGAVEGEGRLAPSAGDGFVAATIPGTGANFNPAALLDPSETELSALVPETELPTESEFGVENLLSFTELADLFLSGDSTDFQSRDVSDLLSTAGRPFLADRDVDLRRDEIESDGPIARRDDGDTPGEGSPDDDGTSDDDDGSGSPPSAPDHGASGDDGASDGDDGVSDGDDDSDTPPSTPDDDPASDDGGDDDASGGGGAGGGGSGGGGGGSGGGAGSGGGGSGGGGGGGGAPPGADIDLTSNDVTAAEDGPPIPLGITAAVTDPGETFQSATVTFTDLPATATVNVGTLSDTDADGKPDSWTGNLAELTNLKITPPEDFSGTVGAEVTVTTDQGSETSNFDIDVEPRGDIDLVANPVPATVDEGKKNIQLGLEAKITDVDNSESADTVTIDFVGLAAGTTVNGGTLSDTDKDGTPDSWTGSLTEFNALTLTPPTNFSGTIDATAEISSNESQTPETPTTTLTVNPVNDPPEHTLPPDQTVPEDDPLTFSAANNNAITVADVDAGTGDIVTTVSVDTGTLAATPDGAAKVAGDGTGTLTITGTLTDVNDTLDGLKYVGPKDQGADATLTITTDDQGYTGSGGKLTDTDTLSITVNPVADQPEVTSFEVIDDGDGVINPNETVVLRTTARFDVDDFGDFSDESEVHTLTVTLPARFEYIGESNVPAQKRSIDFPTTNDDGSVTLTLWTGQGSVTPQNGVFDYEITLKAPNSFPDTLDEVTFKAEAEARETANDHKASDQESVTVDLETPTDIPQPVDDSFTVAADGTVSGNLLDNDKFGDDGKPSTGTPITQIKDEAGNVFTLANPNGATKTAAELAIPTNEGGTLTVDFDTGDFTYEPPAAIQDGFERFNYTIVDENGDTGNADLEIQIEGAVVIANSPNSFGTTTDDVLIGDPDLGNISFADVIFALSPFNPGTDGDDIVFGDVPDTTTLYPGSDQGVKAFNDNGLSNSDIQTILRNSANWDDLNDPVNGGVDQLYGGPGDDVLFSGGGDPNFHSLIVGGPGNDIMYAGNEEDVFEWRSPNFSGGSDADGSTDEIRGFDFTDDDSLDLSQILDFNAGDDITTFIDLSFGGGDATFSIDTDGNGGPFDNLKIVLQGVDKATAENDLGLTGSTTGDIVQAMVTQGHIVAA